MEQEASSPLPSWVGLLERRYIKNRSSGKLISVICRITVFATFVALVSRRKFLLATCAKSLWCLLFCTHFAARTKFINARTVHCARCSAVWSPNKHLLQAEDHLLLWDFRNTLAMQCQLDYELFSCISLFHILLLRKLKLHSFWRLYKMRVRPILDFIQLFMEWFPSSKLTSNLCTSLNLGVYIYTWMIEWMNWF